MSTGSFWRFLSPKGWQVKDKRHHSSLFPFSPSNRITHPKLVPSFRWSLTFWKYGTSPSVLMSRCTVRPALQKLFHVMVALSLRHLPFLRNWLSSHCQVCLILSCLTRCYLEPRLSGPLNPFVTHNNKKLGRCSLSGDWEEDRWTSGKFGWEEVACAQVPGNSGKLLTIFLQGEHGKFHF